MPHDHVKGLEHRHVDPAPDHLHSHVGDADHADELQILAAEFIAGWRASDDKAAYLRLAGVPMKIADAKGGPSLKLVDVAIESAWQVAAANPAFGSRELNHQPYPGAMIKERTNMNFVYVSLNRREEVDLRDFLSKKRLG
ncbi:MAG: hypothetical protein AAF360_13530 [Pseudomonadota bacterium]